MKILSIFTVLFILINCKATKIVEPENLSINGDCVENLDFKKSYFDQLKIVDSLMNIYAQRLSKNSSLIFISKYTHVSVESMLNYAEIYPFVTYKKDRKGWILWYELKKCNNIQFKK